MLFFFFAKSGSQLSHAPNAVGPCIRIVQADSGGLSV